MKQKLLEEVHKNAIDKAFIEKFFEKYHCAVNKYKIKPNQTYNIDEIGMQLDIDQKQWAIIPVDKKFNYFYHHLPSTGST